MAGIPARPPWPRRFFIGSPDRWSVMRCSRAQGFLLRSWCSGAALAAPQNDWGMLTAWFGVGIAAVCWIFALTKFDLSRAYPFMSATFVLVLIGSAVFFNENLSPFKVAGLALIVAGLAVGSQG